MGELLEQIRYVDVQLLDFIGRDHDQIDREQIVDKLILICIVFQQHFKGLEVRFKGGWRWLLDAVQRGEFGSSREEAKNSISKFGIETEFAFELQLKRDKFTGEAIEWSARIAK